METKPSPLLLPNHFLQHVQSCIQSSNKTLAIALQDRSQNRAQGLEFLTVFQLLKLHEARLLRAKTNQEMCAMTIKMQPKEKRDSGY